LGTPGKKHHCHYHQNSFNFAFSLICLANFTKSAKKLGLPLPEIRFKSSPRDAQPPGFPAGHPLGQELRVLANPLLIVWGTLPQIVRKVNFLQISATIPCGPALIFLACNITRLLPLAKLIKIFRELWI
jgi:hypothetical protein